MIKEELTRHEVVPDPNPWLEDKIQSGTVKIYSDRDIVTELGKIYGTSATNMYLTLLQTVVIHLILDFSKNTMAR